MLTLIHTIIKVLNVSRLAFAFYATYGAMLINIAVQHAVPYPMMMPPPGAQPGVPHPYDQAPPVQMGGVNHG